MFNAFLPVRQWILFLLISNEMNSFHGIDIYFVFEIWSFLEDFRKKCCCHFSITFLANIFVFRWMFRFIWKWTWSKLRTQQVIQKALLQMSFKTSNQEIFKFRLIWQMFCYFILYSFLLKNFTVYLKLTFQE